MKKPVIKPLPSIIFILPDKLLTHPKNMRRFYPADQVREMANSIRAAGGVLQSLLIVPADDHPGSWYVVDGNMRLAGARLLGAQCPPLKCEPIPAGKAEELLAMTISNTVRYDPDPVSEGLHYQALEREGLSIREISKRTGVYEMRIRNRMRLLDRLVQIQQLMAEGNLPTDKRVSDALLSIPDPKVRIELAQRLARNPGVKILTVERAAERLRAMGHQKKMVVPSIELALGDKTPAPGRRTWHEIREASGNVCAACDVREYKMPDASNPAWSVLTHAAGETCGACSLREAQISCGACPLVEMLKRLTPGSKPAAAASAAPAGKEKSNGRGK